MATPLHNDHVQSYWNDGFLFPIRVMEYDQAIDYRRQLEKHEAQFSATGESSIQLNRPFSEYKRVQSSVVMPMAAEMALQPAVLDAVESIIGPNIMVWGAEFFIKEANTPDRVSMHQDLTYWGFGETSNQVTAWIALSPSTLQSGCMDLVKASHKNSILPHKDTYADDNMLSRGQEVEVHVNDDERTHVELQPGEMSLHHGLSIHGSQPNQSDDRRIGFAIRYINPDAQQLGAHRVHAMMARGVDRSEAFIHYAPPASLFHPTSLELYEEIRDHQAKTLGAGMDKSKSLFNHSSGSRQ
ncbi:MAG: phytanoyl-CoA dioxygenase family protein [Granulosicoccus sp.]|nr:phytanoyl-CoA dioxygenase family protein [Granulosicoccus sp.]